MAVRERRLPRTQQPQDVAGIDWGNPLTRGLTHLILPSVAKDLVTGALLTQTGTPSRQYTTSGVTVGGTGSTSNYWSMAVPARTYTRSTILALITAPTTPGFDERLFALGSSASNSPILALGSGGSVSGARLRRWVRDNADGFAGTGDTAANVFTTGFVLAALSYDGATLSTYVDGRLDAAHSGAGLSFTVDQLAVGCLLRASPATPINASLALGAVWDRSLDADEHSEISSDPWQLLEPQRIWVPVSAGGGGATPQTLSSSLSLAVQVARSATASLGLAVQAPASATASVTLAVQQALTAQASLGTAVQLARTAAASLDTAVQTARSASTGTSLAVQAPASAVLSADIAVQQASSASASVDAYVQAATQLVASLDLLVQEGHALSVALEVAVQAARTGTSSVDLAVQAARAASTGVDTAVQQARSAAASVGLAVQAARAAGASVDLYVQAGFALVAGLDVAVRFAASAAASVDLAVATARSASVQIGAAVAVQQVLGAAMQAAVRASAVATCGVGLYVDDPAALVHSAAPLVPRVQGAARRAAVQSVIRAAAGQRTRR